MHFGRDISTRKNILDVGGNGNSILTVHRVEVITTIKIHLIIIFLRVFLGYVASNYITNTHRIERNLQ